MLISKTTLELPYIDPDDRDITLEVGQEKQYRLNYNTTDGANENRLLVRWQFWGRR